MSHNITNTHSAASRLHYQQCDQYILITDTAHLPYPNRFSEEEDDPDLVMFARQSDESVIPSNTQKCLADQDASLEYTLILPRMHQALFNELDKAFDDLITPHAQAQDSGLSSAEAASLHLEHLESGNGEEQLTTPSHDGFLDQGHRLSHWLISSTKSDPFHLLDIDPECDIWGEKEVIIDRLTIKDLESTNSDDISGNGPQVWSKHSVSSGETDHTLDMEV